jgi:hypothetical protein
MMNDWKKVKDNKQEILFRHKESKDEIMISKVDDGDSLTWGWNLYENGESPSAVGENGFKTKQKALSNAKKYMNDYNY